ncbi:MAG TPA: YceI family protein [Saprospiraceae bacterium]|nr:YceI family protein [Saprospiraceae bacterium]MCB9269170.1 YceI family protein [Lewinellaceae bacterium]HPG05405.1 YceI family protein [Saprospiraceae bacterium]HPQ99941.1 YceI family protein [Saprospiraceae bacterium]HQU54852.1 YceI family protein [Saprospiraceae bacterium]
MKKGIFAVCVFLMGSSALLGQKYFTKDGKVSFYSDAPMEKIEAHNTKAASVIDAENGQMEFAVLIKAFQFEKALMQEHFNENYMESSTYPKASFKGKIEDPGKLKLNENGTYETNVTGDLTIHGVTKSVTTPATFTVQDGQVVGKAMFTILIEDYGVKIPSVVKDKIAKEVKIDIESQYLPMDAKS